MKKIIETSAWTLWITFEKKLKHFNVVDTMRKFIETLTLTLWMTLEQESWTWTLSIISLTLFSDNVHVTTDAMLSSLFEMLMCVVVVLDPIVKL